MLKALYKLVSTLLVLKALSDSFPLEFGVVIEKRVQLSEATSLNQQYGPGVEKAISFVVATDRAFPGLCVRLELGHNWGTAVQGIIDSV